MEVRSGYASASLPFIQKKKKIKMYNFAFSLRDHYTQKGILPTGVRNLMRNPAQGKR